MTRGGGVGVYLKESIKFKRRPDLEKKYPGMEHLWLEISGRNRHSKLLLGTICSSERIMCYNDWLENFKFLLSEIAITWDGMLRETSTLMCCARINCKFKSTWIF